MKIIEDINMTEDFTVQVKRTIKERLFTLPFSPLKTHKKVTKKRPSKEILMYGDKVIMHPCMKSEFLLNFNKVNGKQK